MSDELPMLKCPACGVEDNTNRVIYRYSPWEEEAFCECGCNFNTWDGRIVRQRPTSVPNASSGATPNPAAGSGK
jgi:hypothetical protein